ncbi:MAG: multidrug effflux MFS transporter [Gammaproteobacteria bacterium]|nr:multidrug effflux MFS transporter [Gammaproteobacteria bacterium]
MKVVKFFPLLIAFYELVTYLSNDMYLPALPQMAKDLSTTDMLAQLSLTTWFLGAVSMQLFLGPLSDRYGRRPILFGGSLIFILATVICASTSNIFVLLIARFFQGCAVCSVTVAGYAAIHELYDQKAAMKAFAVMASITVLAPAFGPLVGSVMLKFGDWRNTFWLLAGLAVISLALLYKWMPESLPIEKRHPINIRVIGRNYGSILTNAGFMLNALAFCATFAAMIAWIAMGPFLVINAFHDTPVIFGVFQALVFGSFIIGTRFVKRGLEVFDTKRWLSIALSVSVSGGLLTLIFAMIFPTQLIYFIVALMLFSFGNAFSFSVLQRLAIDSTTVPMGARMAIFSSMMSASGTVGSLLAGYFYSGATLPLAWIVFISGLVSALLVVCVRFKSFTNRGK